MLVKAINKQRKNYKDCGFENKNFKNYLNVLIESKIIVKRKSSSNCNNLENYIYIGRGYIDVTNKYKNSKWMKECIISLVSLVTTILFAEK